MCRRCCADDALPHPHVVGGAGGGGGGAGSAAGAASDPAARREAVDWLREYASNPGVQADLESWTTVGAPVQIGPPGAPLPPKERIQKGVVDALADFDISVSA
jgi:hypothetical protein